MKLFYSDASPYARAARMVVFEAELLSQVQMIESHPFDNAAELLVANPLGKVPCLTNENDLAVFDSEVICQYLDENYFHGKLWHPLSKSWRLRTCYSLVSGLLDTSVALQQENVRRKDGTFSEFWWQRFVTALDRGLQELNKKVTDFPAEFSLLHINTLALLGYLDYRHASVDWRTFEKLNNFYMGYEKKSCFIETVPK